MSEWATKRLAMMAQKMGNPTMGFALEATNALVEFRAFAQVAHVVSHPDKYTAEDMTAAMSFLATLAEEAT